MTLEIDGVSPVKVYDSKYNAFLMAFNQSRHASVLYNTLRETKAIIGVNHATVAG